MMINPIKARRDMMMRLNALRAEAQQRLAPKKAAPEMTCPACKKALTIKALARQLYVCPLCGHHLPISARVRLRMVADRGSIAPIFPSPVVEDALHFPGYLDKLAQARARTKLSEAVVCAAARIEGHPVVLAVLDSRFLMGSMGVYLGEAVTCAIEYATQHQLPLIIFSASGGARMQEGIFSLMQMVKTSAALKRFDAAGGLYISYLTHPTTGGVSASFAGLGDITLAEPGALIGFAGPRVIEQTIRQKLPDGFQRAEYLEQHGFVDHIVPRSEMRPVLAQLLALHQKGGKCLDEGA